MTQKANSTIKCPLLPQPIITFDIPTLTITASTKNLSQNQHTNTEKETL